MADFLITKENSFFTITADKFYPELRLSFKEKMKQHLLIKITIIGNVIINKQSIFQYLETNGLSYFIPIKVFEGHVVEVEFFNVKEDFEVSGLG